MERERERESVFMDRQRKTTPFHPPLPFCWESTERGIEQRDSRERERERAPLICLRISIMQASRACYCSVFVLLLAAAAAVAFVVVVATHTVFRAQ